LSSEHILLLVIVVKSLLVVWY